MLLMVIQSQLHTLQHLNQEIRHLFLVHLIILIVSLEQILHLLPGHLHPEQAPMSIQVSLDTLQKIHPFVQELPIDSHLINGLVLLQLVRKLSVVQQESAAKLLA